MNYLAETERTQYIVTAKSKARAVEILESDPEFDGPLKRIGLMGQVVMNMTEEQTTVRFSVDYGDKE